MVTGRLFIDESTSAVLLLRAYLLELDLVVEVADTGTGLREYCLSTEGGDIDTVVAETIEWRIPRSGGVVIGTYGI